MSIIVYIKKITDISNSYFKATNQITNGLWFIIRVLYLIC